MFAHLIISQRPSSWWLIISEVSSGREMLVTFRECPSHIFRSLFNDSSSICHQKKKWEVKSLFVSILQYQYQPYQYQYRQYLNTINTNAYQYLSTTNTNTNQYQYHQYQHQSIPPILCQTQNSWPILNTKYWYWYMPNSSLTRWWVYYTIDYFTSACFLGD